MSPKRSLRVVIDARLRDGEPGGVQQMVIGLASGLSRLSGGAGEEYLFLAWRGASAWLQPHVRSACRLVEVRSSRLRAAGRAVRRIARSTGLLGALPASRMSMAQAPAVLATLRADVVHFPTQRAFPTTLPNVYQPHDLQHVHLPDFFTPAARSSRDRVYRTCCEQASVVVVMSRWGRDDIVREYALAPSKVAVVPEAPLLPEYPLPDAAAVASVRSMYGLPERFAYYPAHTFPHKNHLRLLEALAWLRDSRGLDVPLVCSGGQNEFFREIRGRLRMLRLEGQVRFVGFVAPLAVSVLYRTCAAVVFPTLFEGWGLPLGEALTAGVPVACSSVTCLPEQADGAARLFDPTDVMDMARAIEDVWTNESLRGCLVARGRDVVARFNWDRSAEVYRALYRRLAGRALTERDRQLLEAAVRPSALSREP